MKTMQIREDPPIPRVKGTNVATRTMTTNSIPMPQQSIPPRLSKPVSNPLVMISLSTSATDLRRLRKRSTSAGEELTKYWAD